MVCQELLVVLPCRKMYILSFESSESFLSHPVSQKQASAVMFSVCEAANDP